MKSLIVGYGEVGQAVEAVIDDSDKVYVYDTAKFKIPLPPKVDILHVCFPWSATFIHDVGNYMLQCNPKYVVIWSTVPIGTTKQLGENAVHSPIEGLHPHLEKSIRMMRRWVGGNSGLVLEFMTDYFHELGLRVEVVPSSDFTEFLKLRSTAKYGINIAWTDYEARVADSLGMDFELVKDFDRDYNALYANLGKPQYQRYLLDPPEGKIGGHCIVPNAEILDSQYPNNMLKMIGVMK